MLKIIQLRLLTLQCFPAQFAPLANKDHHSIIIFTSERKKFNKISIQRCGSMFTQLVKARTKSLINCVKFYVSWNASTLKRFSLGIKRDLEGFEEIRRVSTHFEEMEKQLLLLTTSFLKDEKIYRNYYLW